MTSEQTVPVPVALLQEVEDTVWYEAGSALDRLREYLPSPPPKVGDKITAQQIGKLPYRAVLTDTDEDVWIADGAGKVALPGEDWMKPVSAFDPYTVIYLPANG